MDVDTGASHPRVSILMTPARYYSPTYMERVAPALYGGEIRDAPKLLREHSRLRAAQPPTPLGYYYQIAALRRWTSLPWLRRLPHRPPPNTRRPRRYFVRVWNQPRSSLAWERQSGCYKTIALTGVLVCDRERAVAAYANRNTTKLINTIVAPDETSR